MPVVRLVERVSAPFSGSSVDRDAGTISGVVLCGFSSANGRDYPAAVLRRACSKYEGRPVNADHGREATVARRLGWFEGVKPGADGRPRGTLHLLKTHPLYEPVMEAARRNPGLFGFSHVALCKTARGAGGREVVEDIQEVESIDLVADPATNPGGLFESKRKRSTVGTTLGEVIEARRGGLPEAGQRATRRMLLVAEQDDEMGGVMDTAVPEPDAGMGDGDAITSAFKAAFDAIRDQLFEGTLDRKSALKKLGMLFDGHENVNGRDEPAAAPEEEVAAAESRKRADPWQILKECREAGLLNPSDLQIEAIAGFPDAAKRAAYIRELRVPVGDKPASASWSQLRETARGRRKDAGPGETHWDN